MFGRPAVNRFPGGRRIWLQSYGSTPHLTTVERAAKDPFPKHVIVTQSTSDAKPEVSGIGINETWADAAISPMAVNECQLCFAHLPGLLHELMEPPASNNLGRMESVKVYLHTRYPGLSFAKHSSGHRNEQYSNPAYLALTGAIISNVFQTDLVVDRFSQPLLAAQIALRRLHADMPKQKLDLLQLAA